VADKPTFSAVLAIYSRFHGNRAAVEFEREYRFSHRPNTSLERTRER
jgi:hypothetical protein